MQFELRPFEKVPDVGLRVRETVGALRQPDKDEVAGILGDVTLDELTGYILAMPGRKMLAMDPSDATGRTIYAVGGLVPYRKGEIEVWMLGTDTFKQSYISMTRAIKHDILAPAKVAGAKRLFCRSIGTHTEAHRWLEILGAKCERDEKGFGINGEDFKTYAWSF